MKKNKPKLYLDTSIPSAYFDNSKPVRQLITQKWFENDAVLYDLYISVITIEEIEETKSITKKQNIKDLILRSDFTILKQSNKTIDLANEYMNQGAIPKSEPEDAYHISIAVLHGIDALGSWNFSHIVSYNPIRKIHEINRKYNYSVIEIGSLQLFGGAQYGNI